MRRALPLAPAVVACAIGPSYVAHPPSPTPHRRVLQTLHALKDLLPDAHIVLTGILPRGNGGPQGLYHWPSAFAQPIRMINAHFRWEGCGSAEARTWLQLCWLLEACYSGCM